MTTKQTVAMFAALGLTMSLAGGAHAQFIQNGGFETTTHGGGKMGYNTDASGWTTTGYNFIFTAGSADTTGAPFNSGALKLWGPHNGSNNGLTPSSPTGGNFVGADGAYQVGAITQTVGGLTVGHVYALSFDWAAGQQYTFTGPTTDQWIVKFGNVTQTTPIDNLASHGFAPWTNQTFDYTATSTSQVLSFLAKGTPNGTPPFALLDSVKLSDLSAPVPEPSALASMFAGVLGLAVIVRRRALAKKTIS